ncbi:MAG TPA: 3-methyl-2-oxobutanoate dehydrogenase subunit beta, partial [Nitrososphaerales archaeon]|nr:3-methyl-2-oxobutanoate dehydrogenase subunit beta [Nitrososphaerales archaeon]
RLCKHAVNVLRGKGVKVGLFRPVTLWPFPSVELRRLVEGGAKKLVVVELNNGQMIQDVRLAVEGGATIEHVRKMGGLLPSSGDVVDKVEMIAR